MSAPTRRSARESATRVLRTGTRARPGCGRAVGSPSVAGLRGRVRQVEGGLIVGEPARLQREPDGGHRPPGVPWERWARALDLDLTALPRPHDPIVEVATALSDADDSLAFRLGLELLDRLREMGEEKFADAISHAPRVSSEHDEALIAAVVEMVAIERDIDAPAWCAEPVTSPMWWVPSLPSARRHALATCPAPLRARGIMIDDVDVKRV